MHVIRWGWLAALFCWAGLAQALAPIPAPTGYVTDAVGVIEPQLMAPLQIRLARYEVQSGRKLAVLLVEQTPGEALEAYADRVLASWKLGQARSGGALLLWSAEGYILIRAVGPALEGLSDTTQADILSRWVVPEFAQGRAGQGIRNGIERMIAVLDGGEVGHPQPEPASEMAEPQPEAEAPAFERDQPGSIEVTISPNPLQPFASEVDRLARGFQAGFSTGLGRWYAEAAQQLRDLPVLARAVSLQLSGEQVEPPFGPLRIGAVYVLIGTLIGAAILLGRGAPTAALLWAGVIGGPALAVASGFIALAAGVLVLGLSAPVLVPVLRVVLRGADDSEREPDPPRPVLPAQTPRRSTLARAPSRPRPASTPSTARPLPGADRTQAARARMQQMQPTLRQIEALARAELRQLRAVHAVVLFVLLVLQPGLAILTLLGVLLYKVYRSGIGYLLTEVLVLEPQVRRRLQQQLPRPRDGGST